MLLSPLLLDGVVVAAVACGVVPAGLGVETAAAPDCEVLLQAPIDCASLLRRAFIFFMNVILPVCCGVRQDSQLQRNQPVDFPLSPLPVIVLVSFPQAADPRVPRVARSADLAELRASRRVTEGSSCLLAGTACRQRSCKRWLTLGRRSTVLSGCCT